MTPFVVFSLPRSRSFWLSKLLGCRHDPSRFFAHDADIQSFFAGERGAVDTAMALIALKVQTLVPTLRMVTIRRPVEECFNSVLRLPVKIVDADRLRLRLYEIDLALDLAEHMGARSFLAEELDDFEACAELYRHCRGEPLHPSRWKLFASKNLQTDFVASLNDCASNRDGLSRVYGGMP